MLLLIKLVFIYKINCSKNDFDFLKKITFTSFGYSIFSFIENEAVSKKTPKSFFDLIAKINKLRVTEKNNPIRILKRSDLIKLSKKFNFKLFGEKIILESFDNFSKKYKIHRYIALKK